MKKEIKITTDKKTETPNNNACFTINEEYFNELSKLIIKLELNSLNNEEEIIKKLYDHLRTFPIYNRDDSVPKERILFEALLPIKNSTLGTKILLANTRYIAFTQELFDSKEEMSEIKRETYNTLVKTLNSLIETSNVYSEGVKELKETQKITKR